MFTDANQSGRGVMAASEVSDQQKLMLSMASGSQVAFGLIYDHLCVTTFAICTHHSQSPAGVDEVMHDLWLYVWQNAPRLSALDGSPWSIIISTAEQHAAVHAQAERLHQKTDTTPLGKVPIRE
ncbi:hypothetical protein BJQ94_11655 [Cryobacterium sp. SO2]|uniref:hypothetical protein n=1 Tax=Cryobacterium sp. SO2 TaxID=1897060 RepID=UPI00223D0C1E|nr:hypothetical protein [Cryobacterium sp. SO2]WEO76028.1 hypothetical protein BJQ94_11655 [Cryobacterium sp. SO2]